MDTLEVVAVVAVATTAEACNSCSCYAVNGGAGGACLLLFALLYFFGDFNILKNNEFNILKNNGNTTEICEIFFWELVDLINHIF